MKSNQYILYLEDDPIDAIKFRSAMKELGFEHDVKILGNGEEGLEWLEENRHWLPNIIILDLNMPKMNGLEFLEVIKEDELYKRIPVIIFSTSDNKKDIHATYEYQIAGYMVKPFEQTDYIKTVNLIHDYWSMSSLGHL